MSRLLLIFALLTFVVMPPAWAQPGDCTQPEAVCRARAAVFAISAFDPAGSAVRIGDNQLVASRHVIADSAEIKVLLPDGGTVDAEASPSDYTGDIVLLRAEGLPPGPALSPRPIDPEALLYTVGADVSFGGVRAYDPGDVTLMPAAGKPLARLHHSAFSQPGNSGGALVDAGGALVAIVASGGEGRHEAVPALAIEALKARSGPAFAGPSAEIGAAIRICTLLLETFRDPAAALADADAVAVATSCRRTGNRQFFDLAAQTLGARGRTDAALALFEASLDQDPNALNGRLGLAITYHAAARFEDELPHLRFLLEHLPEDPQVVRLAIQAGVWAGDAAMAEAALETLKRTNPNLAPVAEQFVASPPPRPQPR